MSAAAKNKKRSKGKTVTLSDFLNDDKDNPPGFTVCHVDWADAMENEELDDKYTLDVKKVILPTAPKSARGPDIDLNKVPTKPPFTAYVGNLPYDATEEDIEKFFRKIKLDVSSVRIPREGGDRGRVRGFGYAEFPDRKSLIEALSLHNETLKSRSIRVSLATEHGGEGGERREERSDRTAGDWRSSSSREDSMGARNDRPRNGPFSQERGFDNDSFRGRSSNDFGSYRDERGGDRDWDRDRRFGGDRDRGFGSERREQGRDFGGSRFDDYQKKGGEDFHRRGGEDFPRRGDDYSRRGADDFPRRGGSDFPRRGGEDFPRRAGPSEDAPRDRAYDRTADTAKERPKLQLKPRTVPVDSAGSESAPSKIFGGAKPVDTAARERQIEEKLAKEQTDIRGPGDRNRDEDRPKRPSGGGGPTKSRQALESRNNIRNSQSEDDSGSGSKSASGRERHSSLSSTGSSERDHVREDQDNRRQKKDGELRSNGSIPRQTDSVSQHRMGKDKPPHPPPQAEKEEPIVYTSTNKFSHLQNDDDDVDASASD